IGRYAAIMPGITIGDGAVIGAHAVVARDIPPYAVAVGNPARIVRYRFDDQTISKLLAIRWWDWDLEKVKAEADALTGPIDAFIARHFQKPASAPT
ncbi:MAG: antibiotic acetyltransferase, partial [Mesorhizobium sp.]